MIAEIKKMIKDSDIMKSVQCWKSFKSDIDLHQGNLMPNGQRRIETASKSSRFV